MISALLAPALKWISGGLLFVCIILGIGLKLERIHSRKLQSQVISLSAELKRISTERNEQKVETGKRIETAKAGQVDAGKRAKVVEAAPLSPGKCETPPAVLQADL